MAKDKKKREEERRISGNQFALSYEGISQKSSIEGVACKTRTLNKEIEVLMSCKSKDFDNTYIVILKTSKPLYFRGEKTFKIESSIPKIEFITGKENGLKNYIAWAKTYEYFVCEKDIQISKADKNFVETMINPILQLENIDTKDIDTLELSIKIKVQYKNGKIIDYEIDTNDEKMPN